jgi:hypothetical protein
MSGGACTGPRDRHEVSSDCLIKNEGTHEENLTLSFDLNLF